MEATHRFDVVLVGGGLQNGLIALAALQRNPQLRIAMVERGERPGGNHTWCLHAADVPESARAYVDELVVARWPAYDVRFPTLERRVEGGYAAVSSERFAERVTACFERHPESRLLLGANAHDVGTDQVALDDGQVLHAPLVIDARGPEWAGERASCGYQKFLGLELELEREHGLRLPMLMDACVPQQGGFRFFYVLPFGPRRLLIEDTYFARSPVLDLDAARAAVHGYSARFGRIARVVREETGVLPMPWDGAHQTPAGSPLRAGYAGGFFHPATGYSFPIALRLAEHIATRLPHGVFGRDLGAFCRAHGSQARYAQQLNRLLFHAFAPADMWHVFERFYRMPDPLIHRFYALTLTPIDRARILSGRPPRGINLFAALAAGRA